MCTPRNTHMTQATLEAIKFSRKDLTLKILDQLQLPFVSAYIEINSIVDAYDAIKTMKVRGAPAIAIVGAFAIVIEASRALGSGCSVAELIGRIEYLVTSRPTAVNLSNACKEVTSLLLQLFSVLSRVDSKVLDLLLDYSTRLYNDDKLNNYKIGGNGLDYIIQVLEAENFTGPFSIMTVCNTGSLATSGYGTALGIIRSVHERLLKQHNKPFWLEHVYPLETRPYNQGAKLTTYELQHDNIPFTLVCDSMAASLILSLKHKCVKGNSGPVKFIVTGADRIVKNGDTANKIGTHQLAVIADQFNIESKQIYFIVAAPNTTIDLNTESGNKIIIEERPDSELVTLRGPLIQEDGSIGEKRTMGIAPPNISVWNPAFDVAPHNLIDCIVTEERAHQKNDGEFILHS